MRIISLTKGKPKWLGVDMKNGWIVDKNKDLCRNTQAKTRHSTAVHEAGHAVVAERLGESVNWVRLHKTDAVRGETSVSYLKRKGQIDPVVRAVIAMAGHEAERVIYQRPATLLPLQDRQTVLALGCSEGTLNVVGHVSRQYVRRYQKEIRRVARALLRAGGRLSRTQFLAALGEAPAPRRPRPRRVEKDQLKLRFDDDK